ncbi:Alpha amylase, catalytic domain [Lachnospiraceae bacterium]|nr:Alpha amylase, catalytic domain [Lachnospiraceae bacterium]
MRYPKQATFAQLNLLDSHDVSRFITVCEDDRDRMELALLFQMTFDNYPFSMLAQPTLTAIEVDMYEMGNQAARFIVQRIKKPGLQTQSFCTTPILIEREST